MSAAEILATLNTDANVTYVKLFPYVMQFYFLDFDTKNRWWSVWDGHWNERGKWVAPDKASLDYTSPADGRQEKRCWISLPQFSWFCLACFCIPRGPVWFWRCCQASRSSCICSSMLPLKKQVEPFDFGKILYLDTSASLLAFQALRFITVAHSKVAQTPRLWGRLAYK